MPTIGKQTFPQSGVSRLSLFVVTLIRSFFFILGVYILDGIIDLGTPASVISGGAVLGVILGARFAFSRLNTLGMFAVLFGLWASTSLAIYTLGFIPLDSTSEVFGPFAIAQHKDLTFIALSISLVSTWYFWRARYTITLEIVTLLFFAIYLLSGHRNFRLENPKFLNSMAWSLGYEPLTMLIVFGVLILTSLLVYIFFATLPARPVAAPGQTQIAYQRGHTRKGQLVLGSLLIFVVLYGITAFIYSYFDTKVASLTANGVGQATSPGLSPLGFHSALGSTNQPSALLRLEGDYKENPFSPMLYFRESALSQFNGREMVLAERIFDTDVSETTPTQPYSAEPDDALGDREKVTQSAYLLTDHKDAFAIDYPISISQLKNPNPQRFKAAFRAVSLAPTYKRDDFISASFGDPRWSELTRKHYLETHPDPRYKARAEEVTVGLITPGQKALAVIQYLSKNAIYTLTPNHEVDKDADPVAPFLFGDLRGYCVHFAHATVYMLRSLGIPARIGTGYLTDLSQSKDGHILLRMSDRHAWAEVYITGKGWVPFDTQPEQVESHAELQVDMKLLEELMGMLGPDETILPKDVIKDEPNIEAPSGLFDISPWYILLRALIPLLLFVLYKIYLRLGWMLPGSPETKVRRLYQSLLSFFHDIGYARDFGETRAEFRDRISNELGVNSLPATETLLRLIYAHSTKSRPTEQDVSELIAKNRAVLENFPWWIRALAALNPSSAFSRLIGGRL